ncbi:hypothetical protein L0337_24415 [candidate division KSB1 bacterium]|nr:hypothetical protein [candidate division KSB1 bacterium]
MIHSKLMLFAENIIRDTQTNKISAINIIEEFSSLGFPLFMARFYVLNLLEREKEDDQTISFLLKIFLNEDELTSLDIHADFQDKLRNRSIVTINGLVLPNPGIFRAVLLHNEKEFASHELSVQKIGETDKKVVIA